MTRSIKFRAWVESVSKMLDWEYLKYKSDIGAVISGGYDGYHPMQFTGLLDKNGKEIYESDRLKDLDGNIGVVEFDSGSFIIRHENGTSDFISTKNYFEITGNIYESRS